MSPSSVQGRKKANPAADPRKMRRTIAEDPDWCVCVCVCVFGGYKETKKTK